MQQLLGLFRGAIQASNEQHRSIQQQLISFNAIPDYNAYLVYIMGQLKTEEGSVRQMAGLMLKNNVRQHWATLHAEVRLYVREGLLGSVGDALPFIRTTASSCISTIVAAADLGDWPTLLPTLKFHDLVFGHELGEGAFSTVRYARQIIRVAQLKQHRVTPAEPQVGLANA